MYTHIVTYTQSPLPNTQATNHSTLIKYMSYKRANGTFRETDGRQLLRRAHNSPRITRPGTDVVAL